ATDGFAAEIPAAPVVQPKGSKAWLAIEDPAHPWPALSRVLNGQPCLRTFGLYHRCCGYFRGESVGRNRLQVI
ncbi:hypothetical protein QCD79_33925, partial [Pseudomonas quasicaspiana]|nr:hypothetical protein [Pseudomonas quasicaspiana]